MTSCTEIELWASSGAMALTGRPDGPPRVAPGRAASTVHDGLHAIAESAHRRTGLSPRLPDVRLLGERAAHAGYTRNAPSSCGGAFRTLRTLDGWFGLSLSRPHDWAALPALTESPHAETWADAAAWAAGTTTLAALERGRLLDLACSAPDGSDRPGVVVTSGGRRASVEHPRVLDLTALWAGPLCAHLLGLTGARVTKVESVNRPDGTRFGTPAFFDLLHARSELVRLDFHDPEDLARLRDLARDADLVLEASRPRALRALGLHAEDLVDSGVSWLSITARGRASGVTGFGDDIAVGAGLRLREGEMVVPCGDALADPLTGVVAAAAAAEVLLADRAALVDVSMHDVCVEAAIGTTAAHEVVERRGRWSVECEDGLVAVADPVVRPC